MSFDLNRIVSTRIQLRRIFKENIFDIQYFLNSQKFF